MAPRSGIVIALDDPHGILQDRLLVLDAVVGRQSAPGFAQRHGAAAGVKADADLSGGGDLVIDAAAVREDIRVIEDGRASGRRQLSEPDERATRVASGVRRAQIR